MVAWLLTVACFQLLECVRTAAATYVRTNCDLLTPRPGDYEDPSPLLTPDPHEDGLPLPPPPGPSPPPPPPPTNEQMVRVPV